MDVVKNSDICTCKCMDNQVISHVQFLHLLCESNLPFLLEKLKQMPRDKKIRFQDG